MLTRDHLAEDAGSYRVLFLDRNGRSFAADEYRAASDDDALLRLRARLRSDALGFELWRQDRLVYREETATPAASARAFATASLARR